MTGDLLTVLSRLAGTGVEAAVEEVTDATGLLGDEASAIRKAVPKRQAEFAAGRRAARRALAQLNLSGVPIPARPDRAPQWPAGFVGAISHDNGLAAALVGKADCYTAIGLDLEAAAPFPKHLRDRILISAKERNLNDLEARAVFSAKETLFKALHPVVQTFFGFEAAEVSPDLAGEIFTARLTEPLGPFPADMSFQGRVAITGDRLLTTLVLSDPH